MQTAGPVPAAPAFPPGGLNRSAGAAATAAVRVCWTDPELREVLTAALQFDRLTQGVGRARAPGDGPADGARGRDFQASADRP